MSLRLSLEQLKQKEPNIFSESIMEKIIELKPTTIDALKTINKIGPKKIEKYGSLIIETVQKNIEPAREPLSDVKPQEPVQIDPRDNQIKKLLELTDKLTKQNECHIEIIQKLIRQIYNLSGLIPKEVEIVPEKVKGIRIEKFTETLIKIYGNTYDSRHLIKQIENCTWIQDDKMWTIPTDKLDSIKELFNTNNIVYTVI